MNIDSIFPGAAISVARSPSDPAPAGAPASSSRSVVPAPVPPIGSRSGASAEAVRKSIDAIRQWLPEPVRTDLKFRVDETIDQVVVSVVDQDGKVLRQIPADVAVRVARNLQQFMSGLVDEVA